MNKMNIVICLCIFLSDSCKNDKTLNEAHNFKEMNNTHNPVIYFEIPVTDMERAIKFYKAVFSFQFEKEVIDSNEMALFPFSDEGKGISGALVKGEIYKPTHNGVVIYFKTTDVQKTLQVAVANGGKILYPKTSNGNLGFVAEFEDSEGNRIALHQSIAK
jgi:hypothetical protein